MFLHHVCFEPTTPSSSSFFKFTYLFLGSVFLAIILICDLFDDIFNVGRAEKGLIIVLVVLKKTMPMWLDENQIGTDCSEEAKNIAEILVMMENTKCFHIKVFIIRCTLPNL